MSLSLSITLLNRTGVRQLDTSELILTPGGLSGWYRDKGERDNEKGGELPKGDNAPVDSLHCVPIPHPIAPVSAFPLSFPPSFPSLQRGDSSHPIVGCREKRAQRPELLVNLLTRVDNQEEAKGGC